MKLERRLVGVSSAVMLTAGFLLSSAVTWAEETVVDEVTITVPSSCTMTGTLNTAHTTSLLSGETANNIGTTTLKVICNDSAGYAIYAIGFTDDEDGKTVLTSSTLGSSYDIATSTTVTTGTSSWAMKLATSGSSYLPVIVGSTGDSEKESSTPDFSNYVAVPTQYTRVAYRNSATDVGTGVLGSSLTTTYRVYVSPVQPAGTYIGQVKYTMAHPSNALAPENTFSFSIEGNSYEAVAGMTWGQWVESRYNTGNISLYLNMVRLDDQQYVSKVGYYCAERDQLIEPDYAYAFVKVCK